MATLADGGRIGEDLVHEESARLCQQWHAPVGSGSSDDPLRDILGARASTLDRFDHVQLAEVIRVCRASRTLSEAGRTLFAVSRGERKKQNDADRLQKYLARFELTWEIILKTQ